MVWILEHYRKLLFFALNRFKGKNYEKMRLYFSEIFVKDVSKFFDLRNKKILDVGGAEGEFSVFLEKKLGCDCINLDPFPPKKLLFKKTIKAFAHKIPFKNETFDFVICRGVLEHIPVKNRKKSVDEMFRVLKKGGTAYFVIPPWFNPHAGHMLKPFHILPFGVARFLRKLFFGNEVKAKSYAEATLYPITFGKAKKIFVSAGFNIVETQDPHLRMHFLTKIPIVNEFFVPAVAFILNKD